MNATRLLALPFAALIALAPVARADDAPELKRLRALIVIDTKSNLADSVHEDGERIEKLLHDNVPPNRYTVKLLKGDDVTEAKILDYYKNLKTGPDEALFFFYAGHGAYDNAKKEPVFELKRGDKVVGVLRRTVVQAMEAKGAGLNVILSDCCSSPVRLAQLQIASRAPARPQVALNPTVRALFFQHRGTVDVTAATFPQGSWGDPQQGGIFTRTFARMVKTYKPANPGGDVAVTWSEFFPVLAKETEKTFKNWMHDMDARGAIDEVRGDLQKQGTQRPTAYKLPKPAARVAAAEADKPAAEKSSGDRAAAADKPAAHAVVSLSNQTAQELRFRYRWPGKEWQDGRLAAGAKTFFKLPLAASARAPDLEFKVDGVDTVIRLDARKSTRPSPGYEDGEEHEIKLK
jgi:hypothetical protein